MTITTDMLLAAGCEIGYRSGCACALDLKGQTVALFAAGSWALCVGKPKHFRFRVKAKSRPYIPATLFGPRDV